MFCWYRQWRLEAAVDDGRQPQAEDEQHMATCPACRLRYESMLALAKRLRQEAEAIKVEPSARFVSRTRAAIRRRRQPLGPTLVLWPIYASMAVCGVLLLALAVVYLHIRASADRAGGDVAAVSAVSTLASAASKAVDIADASHMARLGPLVTAPLSAEMARLKHDMSSAARFVAACLPISVEERAEDGI